MSQFMSSLETTSPLTGWQLSVALLQGRVIPGAAWRRWHYRTKFMFRGLTTWRWTAPWLNQLAALSQLQPLLAAQPGLPCKLHRPYLAANLSRDRQLQALCFHYQTLPVRLPAPLFNGHMCKEGVLLASLTGKSEACYHLRLAMLDNLNREGEATLLFTDPAGVMLAEMTFVLMPEHGGTLFIGGLQGAQRDVPHQAILQATKECHGLFPKRLVLEAITRLARALGMKQILAVSNATHMYRTGRYLNKKKKFLHADYDAFWLSMDGQLQESGYFSLPLERERKSLEDIVSKKRAEYRRRFALLDQLAQGMDRQLSHQP